jgi:hypothetical protein
MSLGIKLLAEEIRELAGDLVEDGTFVKLDTRMPAVPFAHPIRMMTVQNFTDVPVYFSFDGINPHFMLPPNGFLTYDFCTNQSFEQGLYVGAGTQIYVSGIDAAGTIGNIYLSAFYSQP